MDPAHITFVISYTAAVMIVFAFLKAGASSDDRTRKTEEDEIE